MPEAIGFLYRPSVLKPELLSGQDALTKIEEISGRDLVRTQWTAGDFDFTLYACHLAWSNEQDRIDGFQKVGEILSTPTPSPYSTDPDIIFLGDFNRLGEGYEAVKAMNFDPTSHRAPNVTLFDPDFSEIEEVPSVWSDDPDATPAVAQHLSTTVADNRRVYDMVLFTPDVDEEFPGDEVTPKYNEDFGIIHFDEPGGFGYQQGVGNLDGNDVSRRYSDHRPVWMRFKTNAGKSDQTAGAALYVATRSGKKYHKPDCRYVRGHETPYRWQTAAEAAAQLHPCKSCKPPSS